ncbi:MAG: DUF58 domain-containing protein [Verrucomicrobia bacterium]|nr:DUF58 domain-containing protein [Verrucomicrobiota bacterium]
MRPRRRDDDFLFLVKTSLAPRNRLLALVGTVLVPLAVIGGLAPGWEIAAFGFAALLFTLALFDAVLALNRAPELRVEFPEVVRLGKDRAGALAFFLRNDRAGAPARRLRLALAWPSDLEPQTDDDAARGLDAGGELRVALPAGVPRVALAWMVTPRRRGRFFFDRLYLEEPSALGFWDARRALVIGCETRVYPDLVSERRQAAAVFLHRWGVGAHARRQVGRGREFEKLRDYIVGDALEDVSWKATARRQRLVSKVYRVERTQEVYVVIDSSRLSARPAPRPHDPPGAVVSALERYVTSTLLLALAAQRQGDNFGLATFADRVGGFVRAKGGAGHFDTCREALYALQPTVVSPDFEEACAFLRVRLRRRALLVFLTALDDPLLAESFIQHIGLLSRQHLVLVNTLRPPGVRPLFDDLGALPETAAVNTTDDVYRRLGGHLEWQKLREVETTLRAQGVRFSLLDREALTAQLITQYLNVKQRQIL